MPKRGRPRKNAVSGEEKTKRGVGRPHKYPEKGVVKKTKSIRKETKTVPKPKKKRGRPRKVKDPADYSRKLILPKKAQKKAAKESRSTLKSGSRSKSYRLRTQSRRKKQTILESEGNGKGKNPHSVKANRRL